MVKKNTKYLKRNALRVSQNANARQLLRRANEMAGSDMTLREKIDSERISAYELIIDEFARNYNISNRDEALDIIQRASKFSGEQARIFMKMVQGEPVHLAPTTNNNDLNVH